MSTLPAISLFSGVGAMDLGLEQAGFEPRVALEYEADAAASLRANRPNRPVIERSILDVPTDELLDTAGLSRGEAALVFGGPPCTPFSKSGYWLEYKRRGLDPKASLLEEFTRVVREAAPAAVLMENVHGLAYQNHNRGPFSRFLGELDDLGYRVRWAILNAADHGVPQLRKRLIVVGMRDGPVPLFPQPAFTGRSETRRVSDFRLPPYRTAGLAIGELASRTDLAEPEEIVSGEYADLLAKIPKGDNYLFFTEKRGSADPRFRWRSRYWTFLLKLDPDRPSTTIQSQPGPWVGPFHWDNRRLRKLEIMRLQTFPDDYIVVGRRRSTQIQIGNAVPPLLAQVVGSRLAAAIKGELIPSTDDDLLAEQLSLSLQAAGQAR